MADKPQVAGQERRTHIRMPSHTKVQAKVVNDPSENSTITMPAETVNISGAGMALLSSTAIEPGTHLSINVVPDEMQPDGPERIVVEVLDCLSLDTGEYVLRCKRREGQIPASLILDW